MSVTLLVNLWSRLCPDLIFWFLESGRWCHWNNSLVCCLVSIYYAGCSVKSSLFTHISYLWIEHWSLTVSLWTQLTPSKILKSHQFRVSANDLMQLKSRPSFLVHHVIRHKSSHVWPNNMPPAPTHNCLYQLQTANNNTHCNEHFLLKPCLTVLF